MKNQKITQKQCAICNNAKGALKKLENSKEWVHVTCGLYCEGLISIDNYKTMSFSKLNDKPITKDKKAKNACEICKSNVGVKKCIE